MACFAHFIISESFTKGFSIHAISFTHIHYKHNKWSTRHPVIFHISLRYLFSHLFIYFFFFLRFQRCCVLFSYCHSSLTILLWSHHVQTPVCCIVSCTICCFLLSPNSSSLFTTPPHTHTLPAPSLPPPPPLRLGSNSTCK